MVTRFSPPVTEKPWPWYVTARRALSVRDRLRLLIGVPLYVRFMSPDGRFTTACGIDVVVQHEWPGDDWLKGAPGCISDEAAARLKAIMLGRGK